MYRAVWNSISKNKSSSMTMKVLLILTLICFIKCIECYIYEDPYEYDFAETTTSTTTKAPDRIEPEVQKAQVSIRPGYEYYPEIQGWLKLRTEPVDWHTARMYCHDEDAILAAPWNSKMQSALHKIITDRNRIPESIYVGIHTTYPEGIYIYENGKPEISQDPMKAMDIESCKAYYPSKTEVTTVNCQLPMAYVCHAPSTSVCGDDDLEYNVDKRTGQCYKFHPQAKAWNDAHSTCLEEGAHLVIVNSDVEAQVLVDLFEKYPYEKLNGTNPAWGVMAVGFYYWKQVDKYVTIYGQTLEQAGYERWSYGNPSSRGKSKELGGGMFRSGLLDDVDKSYKVPFICEKNPIQLISAK